jgi:hypothetical protein
MNEHTTDPQLEKSRAVHSMPIQKEGVKNPSKQNHTKDNKDTGAGGEEKTSTP